MRTIRLPLILPYACGYLPIRHDRLQLIESLDEQYALEAERDNRAARLSRARCSRSVMALVTVL